MKTVNESESEQTVARFFGEHLHFARPATHPAN